MCAILCLEILLWIPVAVKQDDGIRGREVDTQAACPRAEQEDPAFRVGVEGFNLGLAVVGFDGAVNAETGPGMKDVGPVLEDIELFGELGKDDDFVAGGEEGGDKAFEERDFA